MIQGYSVDEIISSMSGHILTHSSLSELKKARILEKIALCDKSLNEGADSEL